MAFASVGAAGSFNNKTASASDTLTPTATIEAGNLAVLVVARDNASGTDGDNNEVTSVTDSASNTWTKAYEYTNAQTGSGAGATVAVFYSRLTSQLLLAVSSITINYGVSNPTATAGLLWEFTVGANVTLHGVQAVVDDNADPSSLGVGTPDGIQSLAVRGIAGETNSSTALTPTGGWTSMGANQTTGGGAAGNMAARGEFVIQTATTATSDPTWVSCDAASVIVALKEVGPVPVGQTTETDAPQAVTRLKTRAAAQTTETDAASALSPAKSRTAAQVAEADTAQPLTHSKVKALAQASGAESAQSVTPAKTVAVGQAIETDAAQAVTYTPTLVVRQATETDAANAFSAAKSKVAAQPSEADTAGAITATKAKQAAQATSTETAAALTAAKSRALAATTETDIAQPITPVSSGGGQTVAQATETDAANPLTRQKTAATGTATTAETALPILVLKRISVGTALETANVNALATLKRLGVAMVSETQAANGITRLVDLIAIHEDRSGAASMQRGGGHAGTPPGGSGALSVQSGSA